MNRTLGRLILATTAAAALVAMSAPVLADGNHARGGGNFASSHGGNSASNRGSNSGAARSYSGGRASSESRGNAAGRSSNGGGNRGDGYVRGGNRGNYSAGSGNRGGNYVAGGQRGGNYVSGGSPSLGTSGSYISGGQRAGSRSGNFVSGGSVGTGRNQNGGGQQFNGSRAGTGQTFATPRYNSPSRNGGSYSVPGRGFAGGSERGYVRPGGSTGHVYSSPRSGQTPNFRSDGRSSYSRPGYSHGGPHYGYNTRYDGRRNWNGGYWRGHYWPRSYYRAGFVTFLPVLPAVYSTYWWGGLSYYYANDHYYTWSDDRYGYVVTDPPPAVESGTADADSDGVESGDDAQSSGAANVFVYPKNGQSEEQTANDRFECHQWAVSQTGFDPTRGIEQSPSSSSPSDYRRAMLTCLDARGYSAN